MGQQRLVRSPAATSRDRIAELSPISKSELSLKTDPLPTALQLPGKKGICFTLREKGKKGSWTQNLPKIKAVNSYWNYSWGTNRVEAQPVGMEFIPMPWGAWGKEGFAKVLNGFKGFRRLLKGLGLLMLQGFLGFQGSLS